VIHQNYRLGAILSVLLLGLLCSACASRPAAAPTAPASNPAPTAAVQETAVPSLAPASPTLAATPTAGGEVALPSISGNPADATSDVPANPTAPASQPSDTGVPATATPVNVVVLPGVEGSGAPGDNVEATVVPEATTSATVNGQSLALQVVASPETRARGLMFYRELAQDAGMLFVFPVDGQQSFWMRNTFVPLSVAFLDAERRIINIADMQPLDDQTFHVSAGPARYAIEVNQGWFAARGIEPGAVVEFTLPPDLEVR
jgi:uncharacterized protein